MEITACFPLLIGILLGILSGIGIGGGSLLMLWLTVVMHTPQDHARLMNLMFFIPCALSAGVFHLKRGKVNLPLTLTAAAAGLAGALLASGWREMLDTHLLHKGFGIVFILCGIRELRYRPKELR